MEVISNDDVLVEIRRQLLEVVFVLVEMWKQNIAMIHHHVQLEWFLVLL